MLLPLLKKLAHYGRAAFSPAQQSRLGDSALFDPLPDRNVLNQRLAGMIAQARNAGACVAVMFIDLDHFKDVNDALGHSIGNKLLNRLALRLSLCVSKFDTVARYGGDEFVMLVRFDCETRLRQILDTLLAAIAEPVLIERHELYVEASIGVSRFPDDGDDPVNLLKKADITMYEAKARGRNGYCFYRSELTARIDARLDISTRLRKAVKGNELFLQYQPQVNMVSGKIVGLEALVRWRDPVRGVVPPSAFIAIAEESGLIVKVGEWVLRRACEQGAAWVGSGHTTLSMSVNLSPLQLQRSDVYAVVLAALRDTGMPAHLLELEVTENAIMDNPAEAAELFARLRHLGIRIAIDDFGTGYSSLAYLKIFKVDRIKIDQTFVGDIGHDRGDETLTQLIIGLSHSLQCQVIAEGVETATHRQFLINNGCDDAQGFYYSHPVDAPMITRMLEAGGHLAPEGESLAGVA